MSHLRLIPAIAVGAGIALLVNPASAAPKTLSKTFDIAMAVPGGAISHPTEGSMCAPEVDAPSSSHVEKLVAPAAGTLKVEISGFVGDWDMILSDDKGKRLAESDNAAATGGAANTGNIVEKLTYKAKKPGSLVITVCNFAGGPSGKGKYTFTYGK